LPKVAHLIELCVLVDTTIHNSINRVTFRNWGMGKDFRDAVPVALPPNQAQNDALLVFAPTFDAMSTGKTASSACQREARP
jgi:hypothetical protein